MVVSVMEKENKPGNEKTCLQGFRSGLTPTGFTAIDHWRLEISDLGSRGIVLRSKALISRFSHNTAQSVIC